jgi:phospholipid transport system transporter-binding protein
MLVTNMKEIALIEERNNILYVKGELHFINVEQIWHESLKWLNQYDHLQFDFSEVGASDSAGLALMLEWIKYAKLQGKNVSFSHVPNQLKSIIEISALEKFIPYA